MPSIPMSLPCRQARSNPSASVMSKWTPSRQRRPYVRAAKMQREILLACVRACGKKKKAKESRAKQGKAKSKSKARQAKESRVKQGKARQSKARRRGKTRGPTGATEFRRAVSSTCGTALVACRGSPRGGVGVGRGGAGGSWREGYGGFVGIFTATINEVLRTTKKEIIKPGERGGEVCASLTKPIKVLSAIHLGSGGNAIQ